MLLEIVAAAMLAQASITQPGAGRLLDDAGLAAALADIAESPRVRIEIIGRSHEGRPIPMIVVARPEVLSNLEHYLVRARLLAGPGVERDGLGPAVLVERDLGTLLRDTAVPVMFAGASWGNEASSVEGLVKAARVLATEDTEDVQQALARTVALIVPLMNPDGRAAALREWQRTPRSNGNSGIANAWGFLINRDFVHATQPESRAIVETILKYRPLVAVDHHEDVYSLGVRLQEVAFVEPFIEGFDVEEHPATRGAIAAAGSAIAARWRDHGFNTLFDRFGDNRFAPLPAVGEGINPLAGSAGRFNLMASLHGVTSFITESARTPGSQSWQDRVDQKSSAVIATLHSVSDDPERFARSVYDRRRNRLQEIGDRFVVVPAAGQTRDAFARLLGLLQLHGIEAFSAEQPHRAYVVPLAQPEGEMAQHLLAPVRSQLNVVPTALGLEAIPSERLSPAERDAWRASRLSRPVLPKLKMPERTGRHVARPGIAAYALVNEVLRSGSANVYRSGNHYVIDGRLSVLAWLARKHGVSLEPAQGDAMLARPLRPAPVALYIGQGVAHHDWGEIAWSLEQAGFSYRVVDQAALRETRGLEGAASLIVPNGSAGEIVGGWSDDRMLRTSPWQRAEPSEGIGQPGLEAIRDFVRSGGTYVGLGAGGAALAGGEYLAVSDAVPIPAAVGFGPVTLVVTRPESPVMFGFDAEARLSAYFVAPPGGQELGFAFAAGDSAVARYAGRHSWPAEQSFLSTALMEPGSDHAAIVQERFGSGQVVLFGIEPTFRGQWPSTARMLFNVLLSTGNHPGDR